MVISFLTLYVVSSLLVFRTCYRSNNRNFPEFSPPTFVLCSLSEDDYNSNEDKDVDKHDQHDGSHEEIHPSSVVQETTEKWVITFAQIISLKSFA